MVVAQKKKIESLTRLIERTIERTKYGSSPASLYEPLEYLMKLGGKRLRPLLTLLAYDLFRPNPAAIAKYAAAIEIFHNFTLMHDDIMDQAPLRRGYPTVHMKWNTNTAILAGDVMLVKVYQVFSSLDPDMFKQVIVPFNHCAAQVCEGQQWDMEFENTINVSEEQYIEMIRLKTAVLLGFSLELGAILAGADALSRRLLREFGTNIGIGFQLKDDLLDAFGDPQKVGKQIGGDIIANKKTFLLIKALALGSPSQVKLMKRWMNKAQGEDEQQKIQAFLRIYNDLAIREHTEEKIRYYFTKGFRALKKLGVKERKIEPLLAFTNGLIERQS